MTTYQPNVTQSMRNFVQLLERAYDELYWEIAAVSDESGLERIAENDCKTIEGIKDQWVARLKKIEAQRLEHFKRDLEQLS